MNSLELINKLYKPYRITKMSKCTIIDSTEGKFVIKPKGKRNINELFCYLKSRNFDSFPHLADSSRSDVDIYEYIEGNDYPKEQRGEDLIKLVARLHSSTVYTKEVREDKFKEIYDNIKNNLDYYKEKYTKMVDSIETEDFMSPSHYLFIRSSSKLLSQIEFCNQKLNEWYESVKDKRQTRVSIVHHNLELDHYINGDKEVLISWDKATTDSPILDIYEFYQKEALNMEFKSLFSEYFKIFPLEDEEKALLFLMICLPKDIDFLDDELSSCARVQSSLDYVYKTEELIRPYYTVDNKE